MPAVHGSLSREAAAWTWVWARTGGAAAPRPVVRQAVIEAAWRSSWPCSIYRPAAARANSTGPLSVPGPPTTTPGRIGCRLLCCAPDFFEHTRAPVREAVLLATEVEVPHAGLP